MKLAITAALAATILSLSAPARADMVDMSTVTCAQLAEFGEEDGSMFLIWLDGWLAGQSDNTTLNVSDLEAQINGIAEKCGETPELSVMNAAKAYLDE
jgi:acid stress chaperone HdeB